MTDPATAPEPGRLRILALDDDDLILNCLREMLATHEHCDLQTQTDGRAALPLLQQWQPQLIICDLSMPAMDGLAFLRLAAAAGYRGSVLIHSGMELAVRRAAERTAAGYGLNVLGAYAKVLKRSELSAVLERLSQGPAAGQSAGSGAKQSGAPISVPAL